MYQSSYEIELDVGFALLEQVEGPHGATYYESNPDEDYFTDLMLSGVYGGPIDPDESQEFYVYTIEWPEELAPDEDDIHDVLSAEFDSLFPGWVFDRDEDKVYILRDPDSPAPMT